MFVISIIYIFMIKRGKYIIFGLLARIEMISVACAPCLLLVLKSGRRGETFIGQDGGGEPINTRWSFWQILISNGALQQETHRLESFCDPWWTGNHLTSTTSVFDHVFCCLSAKQYGLFTGPFQIVYSCNDYNSNELKRKKKPCPLHLVLFKLGLSLKCRHCGLIRETWYIF